MLKPELARQQLTALASAKHTEGRLNRLKKLPKSIAETGLNLLGRQPNGKVISDYQKRNEAERKATATLEAKANDRAKVFAALFPTLASEVEAGWQLFARLPYTVSYDRRSFRAPNRPEAYRTRRQSWIDSLFDTVEKYPDDTLSPEWLAAWAVHLDDRDSLGYLFAAAIDRGDDTVLEIVKDSAAGRHEIGGPGVHTTRALLSSSKPAAWEFAEGLLLAAQRQEGLRQNILEAVDEAHPDAFRRMLLLLLDKGLLRFSSVARAAGVWLGEEESALAPKKLKADLNQLHTLLGDAKAREAAIAKGDPLACYRGLWCLAFADVDDAVARAKPILKDKTAGRRYAAGKLLVSTGLPEVGSALLPLLDDADLRLVNLALDYYRFPMTYGEDDDDTDAGRPKDLFERLEKMIPRLPEKEVTLKPIAEGWGDGEISQETAANLLPEVLDKRPAERLLPYLPLMNDWERVSAIAKLVEPRTLTAQVREMLLAVAGHPSGNLREAALKGLKTCKIAEDEAQTLEGYLTRKNADLRRGLFDLLLNRTDKSVLGSVDRLLASKDANQRLAGLELARRLTDDERQVKAVREAITAYRDRSRKLAKPEAEAVKALLNPQAKPATLDDCLGLIKPAERTPPTEPKKRKIKFVTSAAVAFVRELDAFIHEHKDRTFPAKNYDDSNEEVVLGSAYSWHFRVDDDEKKARAYPLADLWEQFWKSRSSKTRDADGLEVIRARAVRLLEIREGEEDADPDDYVDDDEDEDRKQSKAEVAARKELDPLPPVPVRYEQVIDMLIAWFIRQHPPAGAADFFLDAVETALALVPHDLLTQVVDEEDWRSNDWRDGGAFVRWIEFTNAFSDHIDWTPTHEARRYGLLRWLDEPGTGVGRHRPEWQTVLAAYEAKAATVADFIDNLIGPRGGGGWRGRDFQGTFGSLTGADERTKDTLADTPELRAAVNRCVGRVLDVELARGESPSAATGPAKAVQALFGQATLFRLLRALGKGEFKKSSWSVGDNKPTVLTHLVKNCHPLPTDTPETFATEAKAAVAVGDFPEAHILELALLNPRWATHVERTIGWPGFSEAVWWFIAHTRNAWDEGDDEPQPTEEGEGEGEVKPKNAWTEIVKARTNLTAEQRSEGVVDVTWFHAAYKAVGKDARWDEIETAAKFLGYGQGHKKAARLADVLLGRTKKKELIDGIRQKNLKEYVRLLGLLPLPEKAALREAELMDRHKVLKDYERYARGLSSMSREPAMQASRLGLENLAVTANYPDPLRLEWAVGAKAVADLLKGPVRVQVKNIAVELALGELGVPELTQTKDGQPVKALPPDIKKNAKVAELVERRNDLKKAAASTKRSLEQAMCQGDHFTADEVQQLMGHALVRPVLERLVLADGDVRGYPVQGGKALRDHAGKAKPIPAGATVLIAHPTDLLAAGDWHEWQAECFRAERLQPFKQVFRELYAVTAQEKDDGTKSQRYAGQQLNPTQAMALFGTRGWSTKEGVEKLFREAGLTAEVRFDRGWTTPGEVEGLTIHGVQFHRRGDWKPVPLTDVPVKVFSEVMRDLDLVVSVAHVGGVDPEASASTVEMRAMLLRETCSLLKVGNVKFDSRHAMVRGTLGSYSVHLGSGVVHKQPGGALCIVPVHSQHRGRLFLPFADDDPRTAEVVSKVLLLARDQEIQDPTILAQIAGK